MDEPPVRQVIRSWKNSGYPDVQFALVFALEDTVGHQINGSHGILRGDYVPDHIKMFTENSPCVGSSQNLFTK